jgi:membrane protease YdiL (CAAX protease family)
MASWLVGAAFHVAGGVPLPDAILLTLMLVVMPAFALAQASVLERLPFDRLAAYWSSIATLWILGGTAWLVGTRQAGLAGIGLIPIPIAPMLGWSVALTVAGLAVLAVFRVLSGALGVTETKTLSRLLPRTRRERRVFALLSVAAGVGEEIAYRGYLIPVLAGVVGLSWSVAVSTLVFGLLHAYQGKIGVVRTTVMGGVLAGGYVAAGSVIPAVVAHAAVDLIAGLVLSDWLAGDTGRNNAARP